MIIVFNVAGVLKNLKLNLKLKSEEKDSGDLGDSEDFKEKIKRK